MMADDVISAPCSPHPSSTESGSRRWSNSQSRLSRWCSRLLYLSQKLNPITHSSPIVSVATAAAAAQAFLREEGEHDTQSATPQRPRSRKQLADYYQRFITTNSLPQLWLSHLGAGTHHFCLYYYVMTFFTESAIKSQWKQENLLSLKLTYD